MAVSIDFAANLDRSASQIAANQLVRILSGASQDIRKDLAKAIAEGLDFSAGRRGVAQLRREVNDMAAESQRLEREKLRQITVEESKLARINALQKEGVQLTALQTAKLKELNTDLETAKAKHEAADLALAGLATKQAAAQKALDQNSTKAAYATGAAATAINVMGAASVAGTIAIGGTIKAAGDWQQQMMKLHTAAGVSTNDVKTLSDGILDMSSKVGYSSAQLGDAAFQIAKYGLSASDNLKLMKASAQGANAEGASLEATTEALSLTMHNFSAKADESSTIMSKMVTAVGESRGTLTEFAGALHTIEPMAASLGIKMEDLWGVLSQVAKSGTSFDQAADQIQNAMRSLSSAQGPAAAAMAQLGINIDDVSMKLKDRGLAGTLQYLSDTVMTHLADQNHIAVGEMRQAAQAQENVNEMLEKMSPYARQHAEALRNNSEGSRAYTMAMRTANEEDRVQMEQVRKLIDVNDGFSKRYAKGRETLETYTQAMVEMTGTTSGAAVAFQTTGEHAKETNEGIQRIRDTTAEADGTVKGFNETQETLNAKMRDAHAAFNAMAIEVGTTFVPIMTDVANIAKNIGEVMSGHPAIMHAAADAVVAFGTAWLGIKAMNILGTVIGPIADGIGMIIGKEEAATAMAGRLSGALGRLGKGFGLAMAAGAVGDIAQDATQGNDTLNSLAVVGTDAAQGAIAGGTLGSIIPGVGTAIGAGVGGVIGGGIGLYNQFASHATGGPVHGKGPNGVDSVLTYLAPGEHVLTHGDVAAMGGHGNVHAFRNALHRQDGGAIGPDVQVAHSMMGVPYNQGNRADCSGMVGRVILGAMGLGGGSLPTTKNMGQWLAALGFHSGMGGAGSISVGWYDHGPNPNDGHTAMTLTDGEHAESGGSHGNFLVGAGAAGANSSQFDHHMFLPTMYGEGSSTGMPNTFGGSGGSGGGGGGSMPAGSIPGFGPAGQAGYYSPPPAGATTGTGPEGQPGYYTPVPERVDKKQEEVRHIEDHIKELKEKEGELKTNAKQSERNRLQDEIKHANEELRQANERLNDAQQGEFHPLKFHANRTGGAGRGRSGRRGGGGSPFMPVGLSDNFGLNKGLPGLAEWAVGFLEDLVLGPLEAGAMAQFGGMGSGEEGAEADLSGYSGMNGSGLGGGMMSALSSGGFASSGAPSMADFKTVDVGGSTGSRGSSGGATGGGPGGGPGGGVSPGRPASTTAASRDYPELGEVSGQPSSSSANNFYKDWYPTTSGNFYKDPDWYGSAPTNQPPAGTYGVYGVDDARSQFFRHNAPPLPPGPYLTGQQQQQSMLGGAGTGGPAPSEHPLLRPTQQTVQQNSDMDEYLRLMHAAGHLATGGPVGTDTVPAWLSPGEFVMNADATKNNMNLLKQMNGFSSGGMVPQYFDAGSQNPIVPTPVPGAQTAGAVQPTPPKPPANQAPAQPKMPAPGDGNPKTVDIKPNPADLKTVDKTPSSDTHNLPGLTTPGAGSQQPGTGQPASPGIGFDGGLIGMAEGAASAAASASPAGPAGGAAMSTAFQLINRAASYGAQVAGIGVEGLLETFLPSSGSAGGDWSKTIPGKLLMGVTGIRPNPANTAGNTQLPAQGSEGPQSSVGNQFFGDVHVNGVHNPDQFNDWSRQQAQSAVGAYPANSR